MDINTAKRAALEGKGVIFRRPGSEPVRYGRISAICFKPKEGRLITSLELEDMVLGVTYAAAEYVETENTND